MSDPKKPEKPVGEDDWSEAMSEQQKATDDAPEAASDSAEDLWGDAMAEQAAAESQGAEDQTAEPEVSAADDKPAADDASGGAVWDEALAEQAAVESAAKQPAPAAPQSPARTAGDTVFAPLGKDNSLRGARDLEMIMDIPVQLSVELGRTRITIKQLLELAQGSVIELDGLAGEPMNILINGYLIAQGEVVVVDDKYGIRITEIVTPSERIQRLNK